MFFKKKEAKPTDDFNIVHNVIKSIMPEATGFQIMPETTFEELGFDSISFINLILSLEDFIGKDLEEIVADLDLTSLKTIDDLVKFIQKVKK